MLSLISSLVISAIPLQDRPHVQYISANIFSASKYTLLENTNPQFHCSDYCGPNCVSFVEIPTSPDCYVLLAYPELPYMIYQEQVIGFEDPVPLNGTTYIKNPYFQPDNTDTLCNTITKECLSCPLFPDAYRDNMFSEFTIYFSQSCSFFSGIYERTGVPLQYLTLDSSNRISRSEPVFTMDGDTHFDTIYTEQAHLKTTHLYVPFQSLNFIFDPALTMVFTRCPAVILSDKITVSITVRGLQGRCAHTSQSLLLFEGIFSININLEFSVSYNTATLMTVTGVSTASNEDPILFSNIERLHVIASASYQSQTYPQTAVLVVANFKGNSITTDNISLPSRIVIQPGEEFTKDTPFVCTPAVRTQTPSGHLIGPPTVIDLSVYIGVLGDMYETELYYTGVFEHDDDTLFTASLARWQLLVMVVMILLNAFIHQDVLYYYQQKRKQD